MMEEAMTDNKCSTDTIELVANTIIEEMFAPHEIPLPDDLAELYRTTARKVLDVLGGAAQASWQSIETAPQGNKLQPLWIIGYTSWQKDGGKLHEWIGPCEWITDHFEFANTDFDVFPRPTHWQPWPAPRGPAVSSTTLGGAAK